MSIGTKELAISELDTFEDERLVEEVKKSKAELFNLRFQSATGQLESHGRVRQVKRDIARIYTVIRERELGIRATPDAAPAAAPKKKAAKKSDKAETAASDAAPAAPKKKTATKSEKAETAAETKEA